MRKGPRWRSSHWGSVSSIQTCLRLFACGATVQGSELCWLSVHHSISSAITIDEPAKIEEFLCIAAVFHSLLACCCSWIFFFLKSFAVVILALKIDACYHALNLLRLCSRGEPAGRWVTGWPGGGERSRDPSYTPGKRVRSDNSWQLQSCNIP
jgi:hypothetical protein